MAKDWMCIECEADNYICDCAIKENDDRIKALEAELHKMKACAELLQEAGKSLENANGVFQKENERLSDGLKLIRQKVGWSSNLQYKIAELLADKGE